ncbi:MAG TPA: hypothetical protein VIY09_02565 [Rhizomicrobium sp.]
MILHVPAGSPGWMFAAAETLLIAHIGGGALGVASGGFALAAPKGGRLHRWAGWVFLASMLVMSGIGAAVAPFLPAWPSVVAGLLTFYLVATGWLAARRRAAESVSLEIAAFAGALGIVALAGFLIEAGRRGAADHVHGGPVGVLYIFVLVAALAALGDLKVLLGGGIVGGQRLARHLWRMCVALFVAAASFFLGQQKLLPVILRGSPLMFIPTFLPLAVMMFWLARIRLAKLFRGLGNGRVGSHKLEAA